LIEHENLVVSELIAVVSICHSHFSFRDCCVSGVPQKRKKAQPILDDQLGLVVVCGGRGTAAYCLISNDFASPPFTIGLRPIPN
jgi:hypothetical protein